MRKREREECEVTQRTCVASQGRGADEGDKSTARGGERGGGERSGWVGEGARR